MFIAYLDKKYEKHTQLDEILFQSINRDKFVLHKRDRERYLKIWKTQVDKNILFQQTGFLNFWLGYNVVKIVPLPQIAYQTRSTLTDSLARIFGRINPIKIKCSDTVILCLLKRIRVTIRSTLQYCTSTRFFLILCSTQETRV